MTRLDAPSASVVRDELKQEIKRELRRENARKRTLVFGGCLLVFLALIGTPAFFAASVLAKTGFVDVPVLSSWLYEPSEPSRKVLPLGGSTSESVMRIVATRAKYDPHTGFLVIMAKENELTTLAQHGVWQAPKDSLPFRIREVQIAVDPGAVEVFLVSPQKNREATVLARFTPTVGRDGKIDLEIQELRLGSQEVPRWLGKLLSSGLSAFFIDPVQGEASKVGSLEDIQETKGELKFLIKPNL